MPDNYKGYTVPLPADPPDSPGAFRDFTDDVNRNMVARPQLDMAGSGVYGPAWDGIAPLIEKRFVWAGTTSSDGHISIGFPTPFPHSLLDLQLTNANGAYGGYFVAEINGTNVNQIYARAFFGGGATPGAGVRVYVRATGW